MFAAKENIIRHFETICLVDQGSDINPRVRAVKSIVEKLMNDDAKWGVQYTINIDQRMEASILRGAGINMGLPTEDYYLCCCIDLHSLTVSDYGRESLIDYLADLTKDYFWYAQRILYS